jgi:Tol biopolymer transport system component
VFPDAWPAGQVPYLFGESFLRHLAGRFGRDKVAELSRAYGGRPLPFLVESTGRGVLGREYRDLWREWSSDLRERFGEQEREILAKGGTAATVLAAGGHYNSAPAWSPDASRLAWVRADARERPGIWIMNADGSRRRRLLPRSLAAPLPDATLAFSRDGGRLYYAKPGFVRGAAEVQDVFAWDLEREREIRLTRGLRTRDPEPGPDGRTLALVASGGGRTRLALLETGSDAPARETAVLRPLTEPSAGAFSRPRWSPDGRRIAFGARRPGGGGEIRVVDRDGRAIATTGDGVSLNAGPAWSPDGRLVYFSSDRTGVFNIFTWDPATGRVAQLTNVVGGAFSPAPSPDGRRLAFVGYSARGYDIRVMDLPRNAAEPAEAGRPAQSGAAGTPLSPAPPEGGRRETPALALVSQPYSPAGTIAPRFWVPWAASSAVSGTLAGFVTGAQDALQRHRYTLTGLYAPESGRLMHAAAYAYDRFRPTFRLLSWDLDRTYAGLLRDAPFAADYTERTRALGVEAALEFPGRDASRAIALGYRHRQLSALTPLPPWPGYAGELPAIGALGSWRAAWSYSSAHRQPYSISLEDGQQLELGLERYQHGLGSERTFTAATLDWRGYAGLPAARHVLAAHLFVGASGGDSPPQGAFSLGGEPLGDVGYTLDSRSLPLRGYPFNAIRGAQAVLAGLEYRFPLLEVGRGGVSAPLFLRRLHGALFVDAGEAWDDGGFDAGRLRTGVGAELRMDLTFSYFLPLTVRLGVAAGLDEQGGVYPTLGIWVPQGFLGGATATQRR